MRFRKKPIEIEAIPVREALRLARDDWNGLPEWLRAAYDQGLIVFGDVQVHIRTLEGSMAGLVDDWIILGVKKELYPCKPDVFEATYDPTEKA